MLNGSRFNGAAYSAGSGGVRVLLASAVLAVSATGAAEPLRTQHGGTNAPVQASFYGPRAVADRAAAAIGYPTATFDVYRPWDLAAAELMASANLAPDHLVLRAGLSEPLSSASLSAEAIRYAFFSSLQAEAAFDPVQAWGIRPGVAGIAVTAEGEVRATREHPGDTSLSVSAVAEFNGDVYAGGITTFEPGASLFAEAHLNGIQPGYAALAPDISLGVSGDRLAGGRVDGGVDSWFEASALPGRGTLVDEGLVTAELTAVWWAFNYETATITASAALTASPTRIAAGAGLMDVSATARSQWSLIIEPRKSMVGASASLSATAWRIRPTSADATVVGGASAYGNRITHSGAVMEGVGSVIRNRLSVNLTNPAPPNRQMTVPQEDRVMVVPADNRTMVVT
ncbi:hypothetical protein HPA02_08380 [Bisbaumannia pacifica]|uniref:Uncharacterized protein n=1 Tax=Bisbaumannia pacifica TaxID=77098 RepID=A0A510X7W3_9GAMM|nr:hypothetical protein [Halomonas pacifica]GEK46555.1 hypothetical protein HPA02_08380 [Halomonas pacifica]